jgi:predicted DCC family thiol-disulfide oxidoreductase YuxK
VNFVLKADRKATFRFAPLKANDLARAESVMLRENGHVLLRSDAVLRVFSLLGFPYSLAAPLRLVPLAIRDAVYNWVARNRYRWFGRADSCRIPTADERARFVS